MATSRLFVVNFGASKAGLSTIGYTLYNKNNTIKQARATTGIFEVGTSTGIYAVYATIDEGFDGIILWDTGEGTPRYGVEETLSQLNSIQDETDHIRLIWNILRNQADFYATLTDKITELKGIINSLGEIIISISKKEGIKIDDIRKALSINVSVPDNVMNDIKTTLSSFGNNINNMTNKIDFLPSEQKTTLNNLVMMMNKAQATLARMFDQKTSGLREQILKMQDIFSRIDGLLSKIDEFQKRTSDINAKSDDIKKMREDIGNEIKLLSMLISNSQSKQFEEKNNILMSFGHKR
jgi:DNA-binding transcriptional MerR regulator